MWNQRLPLTADRARFRELAPGATPPSVCSARARAARGVPRRDAAADEASVEASLDERLRHVAPDVEAVGAVDGHRLICRQLGDPLLDAIRITPRRARHQIHVARHVVPLPRVDDLHAAAVGDLRGETSSTESDGMSVVDEGSSFGSG